MYETGGNMKKLMIAVLCLLLVALPACAVVDQNDEQAEQPTDQPTTQPTEEEQQPEEPDAVEPGGLQLAKADVDRVPAPELADNVVSAQVQGNNQFAFDIYQQLASNPALETNDLFFSPYSISSALLMAYAGAEGETKAQMEAALQLQDGESALEAINALNQYFARLNEESQESEFDDFQLLVNNAVWGEQSYTLLDAYLETLAKFFGAGLFQMDFINNPDGAREQINEWVAEQTNQMIPNLLGPGTISSDTRVVLTNTIYFIASWVREFEETATRDEAFTLLDGSQVMVPMMNQTDRFGYVLGDGFQMVELPYVGGQTSMIAIVPDEGTFTEFEASLTGERFAEIINAERTFKEVELAFPKFEVETSFSVTDVLKALGMTDAFDPMTADFSGITGNRDLVISDVVHQAVVKLDEQGTEAAAATAVIMEVTSAMPEEEPPVVIRFDRPFIFAIVNPETGTILFVGRILNPLD
jgi:serpin B